MMKKILMMNKSINHKKNKFILKRRMIMIMIMMKIMSKMMKIMRINSNRIKKILKKMKKTVRNNHIKTIDYKAIISI